MRKNQYASRQSKCKVCECYIGANELRVHLYPGFVHRYCAENAIKRPELASRLTKTQLKYVTEWVDQWNNW